MRTAVPNVSEVFRRIAVATVAIAGSIVHPFGNCTAHAAIVDGDRYRFIKPPVPYVVGEISRLYVVACYV